MIVLDSSAALALLVGQPGVAALLHGRLPHAPHLIDAEVAHALRGLALGGKITPGDGSRRLSAWRGLDIVRIPMAGLFPRVWELRANLTAYDAFFVAAAEALAAPLLTGDRRLAAAPGIGCPIELIPGDR
ncbi:MAG: type II toxin-antitoxin system VapC family toxin [Actinobacteria bacterium]|nr:type II toxin-antitoxin system VapC family toxin [Actinomycetota bacterium]